MKSQAYFKGTPGAWWRDKDRTRLVRPFAKQQTSKLSGTIGPGPGNLSELFRLINLGSQHITYLAVYRNNAPGIIMLPVKHYVIGAF